MASQPPPSYTTSPLWSDISPIPLDDSPTVPGTSLAAIAYPPHYSEAMSYLRAVMAVNEISERALSLTEDIIGINAAHYTVWLYRAKIVRELEGGDLEERLRGELKWVEERARETLKNYQIWHHRQLIMSLLPFPPPTEATFLDSILSLDVKNYHVWTYRQWLVRHFGLWDSPSEFQSVETFITKDVRNNSAWNHRWFLCFGRDDLPSPSSSVDKGEALGKGVSEPKIIDLDILDREISYAQSKILLAPQNPSPWSYLRGLIKKTSAIDAKSLSDLQEFAEQFIGTPSSKIGTGLPREGVKSTHALDWVAECYAEQGEKEKARGIWMGSLGGEGGWDPIRKGYWEYRAGLLA